MSLILITDEMKTAAEAPVVVISTLEVIVVNTAEHGNDDGQSCSQPRAQQHGQSSSDNKKRLECGIVTTDAILIHCLLALPLQALAGQVVMAGCRTWSQAAQA